MRHQIPRSGVQQSPAGLPSCLQEKSLHTFFLHDPRTHTPASAHNIGGAQPLGSFSAEHNCPDETVGTCPLPRGPSAAQQQQGGAARGGPSAPEEADRQGSLFRYPGPPPRWITHALLWLPRLHPFNKVPSTLRNILLPVPPSFPRPQGSQTLLAP